MFAFPLVIGSKITHLVRCVMELTLEQKITEAFKPHVTFLVGTKGVLCCHNEGEDTELGPIVRSVLFKTAYSVR